MKNFLKNPTDINRIEYWAATTMFVFSIFFLVSSSVNISEYGHDIGLFKEAEQHYSYFNNYFLPTLVRYVTFYGSYLLLSFIVVPPVNRKENVTLNVIITLVTFYFISVVLAIRQSIV